MITPPVSWTDSQQHRWELHWYIWRWDVRTRVVLIRPTIDLDAILTAVDKARMCPDDAVPKQILYHKPQCWMCMLSSRRGRHTPQRAHGVCNQSRNAPCRRTGDTPGYGQGRRCEESSARADRRHICRFVFGSRQKWPDKDCATGSRRTGASRCDAQKLALRIFPLLKRQPGEIRGHVRIIDIALYMLPHRNVVKLVKEGNQPDIPIDHFLKAPQFGIALR